MSNLEWSLQWGAPTSVMFQSITQYSPSDLICNWFLSIFDRIERLHRSINDPTMVKKSTTVEMTWYLICMMRIEFIIYNKWPNSFTYNREGFLYQFYWTLVHQQMHLNNSCQVTLSGFRFRRVAKTIFVSFWWMMMQGSYPFAVKNSFKFLRIPLSYGLMNCVSVWGWPAESSNVGDVVNNLVILTHTCIQQQQKVVVIYLHERWFYCGILDIFSSLSAKIQINYFYKLFLS